MKRWTLFLLISIISINLISGCSGGGVDPIAPALNVDISTTRAAISSPTHLWGYYNIFVDTENQTVEAVLNREAMFTANVVNFINQNPASLSFQIISIEQGAEWVDVDINIAIAHPFPGMPQYNGYDVRGIFMGDGSSTLAYNNDLIHPVPGTDQVMFPNPLDGNGGPDGYTRWFNIPEFSEGGLPMFQYTPGNAASPGFDGTATLNPYRYYANGLGETEDLWTWLLAHPGLHGEFTTGATNTRNYFLRFPNSKGVVYGYAIIANWSGTGPQDHPSNAPETIALNITDNSSIYFVDPANNGGNLDLEISVWNWDSEITSVVMEDYNLIIESTVLSVPYQLGPSEMTPISGGEHYSTYHVEIPADSITGLDDNNYWVIVEQNGYDYTNEFSTPNLADTDPLTAFFRYDLGVSNESPASGWVRTWGAGYQDRGYQVKLDSAGNIYVCGFFYYDCDFDPGPGEDFNNSGGNRDSFVTKFDPNGNHLWAATWGGNVSFGGMALDLAVDGSDNVLVTGYFYGDNVDFDPGPGEDLHSYNTESGTEWGGDCYVTKFDPDGNHLWARTWGGSDWLGDSALGVSVDSSGNVYVSAGYRGVCDFDPGPGEDIHTSQGGYRDTSLSSFTSNGDYRWSRQWGGTYDDYSYGTTVDHNDDVYITGVYNWDCDFDPGAGEEWYNANTDGGAYFSKFNSDGDYIRVRVFDAGYPFRLAADSYDNVYLSGTFSGDAQFDPDGAAPVVTANGDRDSFLSMFSPDGAYQWALTWDSIATGDGTSGHVGHYLTIDDSDNIYCSGHFTSTADLNPDPAEDDFHVSGGNRDAFITKFDPAGNHVWSRSWGGTSLEDGTGVAVNSLGQIYSTGYYYSDETDFDPGPGEYFQSQNGNGDAYLIKFLPDGYW